MIVRRAAMAVAAGVLAGAAPAVAQDGLAPIGGPGRAGARAGAGAAAGDDAFGFTRNPAALARLDGFAVAAGALVSGWEIEPRRTSGQTERRLLGGGAAAATWSLGGHRVRAWLDPFAVPLRAGLAWDELQGDGALSVVVDAAPRVITVLARGPLARVVDVVAVIEPVGGGPAVATERAPGGALYVDEFRPVLSWSAPPWPSGRAQLTVRYRWAFGAPGAGEHVPAGSRLEVRIDVDGTERRRAEHARPEPVVARSAPEPASAARPASDGPDLATVRGLERGGARLGLAVAPAGLISSAVNAPGQPSGYSMQYLAEAATVALARDVAPGVSAGVAVQAYASAIAGLELPVTMPDGFGGTQGGALEIDEAGAVGVGASAGLLWNWGSSLTAGLHYQSRAAMSSHRGTAAVRGLTVFGGPTGDTTGEWEVRVRDFGLPQRAGASLAWRPFGDALLLATDLTWWDWSDRLNEMKLLLEDPDSPGFLATGARIHRVTVPFNWEDRFTVAAGATWRPLPVLLLHAGYSWGRNPYTAGSVHPLIPAIVRHHVAGGVTVKLGRLTADASVTWGLPDEARLQGAGLDGARLRVQSLSVQAGVALAF